jgi:hypothetical protein
LKIVALVILMGVLGVVAYELGTRFVLHGRVTTASLHTAVARESGSADLALGVRDGCRREDAPRTYTCFVGDRSGSAGVNYRVRLRPGSSCFDARTPRGHRMPARISGCVYRRQ